MLGSDNVIVVLLTIFPGGYDGNTFSDILRYDPESKEWTHTAALSTPRSWHAVSTLNMASLAAFCSEFVESGTIQSPNYPDRYPNNHDQVKQHTHYQINEWINKIIGKLILGMATDGKRWIQDYAHV